ncbi:MAG: tetratricopeptide repeat protein, partial [Planctomycetota bacterium]|nr:tetratricopeptide repeat protein [Planctomycetota bacterium]
MPASNRSGRTLVLTVLTLTILSVLGGGYYYWSTKPDSAEALRLKIRATSNAGDLRTSIVLLREMVKLRPDEFKVHYSLADHLYFVAKEADPRAIDPPEAIEHLLEASRIEPRNVDVLERLLKDFQRLGQSQNVGEMAMRLVKIGRASPERSALAVRYAIDAKDVEFLKRQSEELPETTLQEEIVKLAVRIGLHEAQGMPGRIYWEAEPALQRILNNSNVRLQALEDYSLPFLGIVLEASVRYAPTGADADRRLFQAVTLVDRLSAGEIGQTFRLELVEMAARPVAAALRSRVREGLDEDATPAQRSDKDTRRKALQKFVDFAEPAFGTGIASPFVYEQISRAALELENDQLAISMLRRGIELHSKLNPENGDQLMSVHAQAAMRLISRGQFEPLRDDVLALSRYEHTAELSYLLTGLMAFQQGKFDEADASLSKIADASPHRVAAAGLRVRVLLMQSRWEDALTLIELIDERWAKLPEVTQHWLSESSGSRDRLKLLQACCLLRLGHIERAVEVLAYLDTSPLRAKSRLIRLIELMRTGNGKRAWEVLRVARTEDPDDFDLLLGEFGMLLKDEATEGARRLLTTFVQNHLDDAHAQIAYAEWLRGQGESVAALNSLAVARAKAPGSVLAWLLTADLLMTEQRQREIGRLVAEMQQYPEAVPH